MGGQPSHPDAFIESPTKVPVFRLGVCGIKLLKQSTPAKFGNPLTSHGCFAKKFVPRRNQTF